MSATLYYRATKDFTFGGVSVRKGEPVPCHRRPWSTLLDFGRRYVEAVDVPGESGSVSVQPHHLNLGELIEELERHDPNLRLPLGFTEPHSYRGYYDQLAFQPAADVTIGEMLADARTLALTNTNDDDYLVASANAYGWAEALAWVLTLLDKKDQTK